MYIHRIKSGSDNQHIKFLLRRGWRSGGKVKNQTLLNVSKLSREQLVKLELALQMKRRNQGNMLEQEANGAVIDILGALGAHAFTYQILNALSPALLKAAG